MIEIGGAAEAEPIDAVGRIGERVSRKSAPSAVVGVARAGDVVGAVGSEASSINIGIPRGSDIDLGNAGTDGDLGVGAYGYRECACVGVAAC